MTIALAVIVPWLCIGVLILSVVPLQSALRPFTFVVTVAVVASGLALATWTGFVALGTTFLMTSESVLVRLAGILLLLLAAVRVGSAVRHLRHLAASRRVGRSYSRARTRDSDIVVIDDPIPDAFAVAGGRGAVVISSGMQRLLTAAELRAVIAHERAHVRYRHSMWIQIAEWATQFNPLLRPTCGAVRHMAERHADEAAALLDRQAAMRAVAHATLARSAADRPRSVGVASSGGDVVRRVQALSMPPVDGQRTVVVFVLAVTALALFALSGALVDVVQDCVLPEPGHIPTDLFR